MDNLCHLMRWLAFVTSLSGGPLRQCMENDSHFCQTFRSFDRYDSRWHVAKKDDGKKINNSSSSRITWSGISIYLIVIF